jgi:hypothetical protein
MNLHYQGGAQLFEIGARGNIIHCTTQFESLQVSLVLLIFMFH